MVLSLSPAPPVFSMSMKLPLSMDFNTAWGEMDMQSYITSHGICSTVNRKIFIVKIFSDIMGSMKFKHMKIMHIINTNTVWGRLSEYYLTYKFIAQKTF